MPGAQGKTDKRADKAKNKPVRRSEPKNQKKDKFTSKSAGTSAKEAKDKAADGDAKAQRSDRPLADKHSAYEEEIARFRDGEVGTDEHED